MIGIMISGASTWTRWLVVLAALCASNSMSAQTVTGHVVSGTSQVTIPGVVVLFQSASGALVARTVSRADGAFALVSPDTGSFTLRTMRIGFQPLVFGPVRVTREGVRDLRLELVDVAIRLSDIRITGKNECLLVTEQDASGSALAVWEAARTGLLATVIARDESALSVTTAGYERIQSTRTGHVLSQHVTQQTGPSKRPFVSPLEPEAYADSGYRTIDRDGSTYRVPDADVLLSSTFAQTHCLHLATRGQSDVGIAFEPLPSGRPVRADGAAFVDVAGTLWLDRKSGALRDAEFRYVGVEPEIAQAGAGGHLAFLSLPSGVPVVRSWSISVPRLAVLRTLGMRTSDRTNVTDVYVVGGDLLEVARGSELLFRVADAEVRGRVSDDDGRPMTGVVSLVGATIEARTDSAGEFRLSHVLPGRYDVLVLSQRRVRLGLPPRAAGVVEARASGVTTAALNAGSERGDLNDRCGSAAGPESTVIMGMVRGPDGTRTSRAVVDASWVSAISINAAALGQQMSHAQATTDSAGYFQVCGVSRGRLVHFDVYADSTAHVRLARAVSRSVPDTTRALLVDIPWTRAIATRTRVTGSVVDETGVAVRNANVDAPGMQGATTDSSGAFVLDLPNGGPYMLRVRSLGFVQTVRVLPSLAGTPVELKISLARAAQQLAGVTVLADSAPGGAYDPTGFERRRRTGQGVYLSETDIAKRRAIRVEQLLASIPGLRVDTGVVFQDRGPTSLNLPNCSTGVQLFIDGVLVSGSGMLAALDVHALKGIEVYRGVSTPPPELRSARMVCGTVAFWTK